jgi:hypothetical protein
MPVEVVWRPGDPSAHYRPCGPPPKPALQPLRATAPRVLGEAGVGAQNRGARESLSADCGAADAGFQPPDFLLDGENAN